ncbi:MAG TPA: cupredoxin domain-containing protein [Acidimicrobiales bacterium]|nr:cupredoxin domain-containing protein [Acidimicrobiales bacterium]
MTKGRGVRASLIVGAVVLALMAQPVPAATINVEMRDDVFVPRDVTVTQSDEILWRNVGANPHTATASNGMFDSGNVDPGGTFTFAFTNVPPGTYIYYCRYHGTPTGQGMAGTITVQASGATTTTVPATTTSTAPATTTTTTAPATTTTTAPATTTTSAPATTTTTAPPGTTTTTAPPGTTTTTAPATTTTTVPPATTTTAPAPTTTLPPATTTTVAGPTTTTTAPPPSGRTSCDQLRRSQAAFNARIDRDERAAIDRLEGPAEARALARLAEARRQGNAAFDRRLSQCNRGSGTAGVGSFLSARASFS